MHEVLAQSVLSRGPLSALELAPTRASWLSDRALRIGRGSLSFVALSSLACCLSDRLLWTLELEAGTDSGGPECPLKGLFQVY